MALEIKAVVTLGHYTDLEADAVMNTFALQPATLFSPESDYEGVCDALAGFYNVIPVATYRIAYWLSNALSRTADKCSVKLYDITGHLDGSPHGSPVYEKTFQLGNNAGDLGMPEEVAGVLTLRGSLWASQAIETPDGGDPGGAPDRPRQRRTGRVYIGPLIRSANTEDTTKRTRPSEEFRTTLLDASEWLRNELDALPNTWQWCVWSRANQDLYAVSDVQVDDAWDTMRSRGPQPTVRDSRNITP